MLELWETMQHAKADVSSAILNREMFSGKLVGKGLENALKAIDIAIADLESQMNK